MIQGNGDAAAESLSRGACPGQIADGAMPETVQGAENIHGWLEIELPR
jgi:hypothetical protein